MAVTSLINCVITTERDMELLGGYLAQAATAHAINVALCGELGAGKTTLVRGFLRQRGYLNTVKSPTFTLVESYVFPEITIYHFDLYRVNDPEELELFGIRDYFVSTATCLVEWPEYGAGVLPELDLKIKIVYCNELRKIEISANNANGAAVITNLTKIMNLTAA